MDYYTETGERPELAALEVNPPEGYIGDRIMPVAQVDQKTGTVYYNDVDTDVAAQTGRSTGSAPTATNIAGTSTTFTCAEAIKRGTISPDEAKTLGGVDKADLVGAKFAKRSVMNARETAIATIVLGTADDTYDSAKLMEQAQDGLDAIRRYEGRTALVGGTMTLKLVVQNLLNDTVAAPLFQRLIAGSSPAVAASGMSFNAWMSALALYLGVDEVLAGDSSIWNAAGTSAEKIGIVKMDPDPTDPLSFKWRPVFGRTFQFLPDGVQPYHVETAADRVNILNLYTAKMWYNAVEFNSSAVYVLDGVVSG